MVHIHAQGQAGTHAARQVGSDAVGEIDAKRCTARRFTVAGDAPPRSIRNGLETAGFSARGRMPRFRPVLSGQSQPHQYAEGSRGLEEIELCRAEATGRCCCSAVTSGFDPTAVTATLGR
jgi:hypothetical protein